jgi:2-iminobutanoate/2-iminopropanoate deaminase
VLISPLFQIPFIELMSYNHMQDISHHKVLRMSKIQRIPTPHSYSAAVAAGDQVYLGLHRGFGDRFSDQIDDAIEGIRQTLGELELTLENLVKVNVWLKHIEDLPEMEQHFNKYFEKDKFPARMTATTEFIDADCLLMIDGIAYRDHE